MNPTVRIFAKEAVWCENEDNTRKINIFQENNIIACPYCKKYLQWGESMAGKQGICPYCKKIFKYPNNIK